MSASHGDLKNGAALILALRQSGIADPEAEKLVEAVPVAEFVPFAQREVLTVDRWLPIECGQSMTPPALTLRVAQALGCEPHHSVLEIGTGTGYLTTLVAKRVRKVLSLDRYRTLLRKAGERCARFGVSNVTFECRDGSVPNRDGALYDRIVIDSAFEQVPRHYVDALAGGGSMI